MRSHKYFLLILAFLMSTSMLGQYNPNNPPEPGVYYTLTLQATPSGAGSFNIGTSTTYSEGTNINLRAYTNSNFSFVGWELDGEVISTSSSYAYTMPARNVTLIAHYEYNPGNPAEPSESSSYSTLFLEASPSNGGYFNISSGNRYEVGSTVSLRAYNNSNFSFKNWTENGEVISTSSSFQYVMKEGNPTLVANFTYNPGNPAEPSEPRLYHKLFLKSNPPSGGYFNVESGNEYQEGSSVNLRAYSNQWYVFNNWSIGDSIISSNYVLNYLMPNSDITLTANYTYSPSGPDEPSIPTTDKANIYGMTENGVRGQTIYYPIFLENTYSVRGMAIDIQFPQGFLIQPNNISLSGRVTGQEMNVKDLGNNLYRFTLLGDDSFTDNNGKLFDVPVSIPDDSGMGQNYPVILTHGVVYGTDGSQSAVSVRSGHIYVEKISEDGLYAKFSYDKLLGRVKFINLSSDNAVSYLWDFGDGTTSTEKDPVHVYSNAGYYEVKLTITGQTDTDVAEQTVLINDKSNWRVDGTLFLAEQEQGVRYFTSLEQLLAFLDTPTLSGNLRIAVQGSCSFSLPLSPDNIERLKQLQLKLETSNYFLSFVKFGDGNVPVVSFGEEDEAFNRDFVDFFMTLGQRINCENVKVRLWAYTINIAIIRELSRQTIHSGEKTKPIDLLGFSSDLSFQWELVSTPFEGVSGYLTSGSQAIPSMTIINEGDGTCQLVYHVVAKRGDETFSEFEVSIFVTPSLVGLFTNLSPGNGSISESSTVTLSWNSIKNAVYDVYLWDARNIRPATPIASDIEVLRYTSQGFCQTGHTYKWQVVAHNEWQTLASDTMFFSVRSLPNLHIISLDCSEAIAGLPMTVKWKVRNDGPGPTDGSEWKDYIWLVPNISVGTSMIGTRLLATCDNVAALKPGETYEGVTNITLAERIYGNYDLLVTSNMYGATDIDYSRTNGVPPIPYKPEAGSYGFLTAKGNSSYVTMEEEGEHDGISDNFFYKRIDIQVPPLPDIQVPSVVVEVDTTDTNSGESGIISMRNFYSGKNVKVTASIANKGGDDIDSISIKNILYISSTPDLSSNSCQLASQDIIIALKAGETMETTFAVNIPEKWYGNTYFIVKADSEDAVYELGNTENNIGTSVSVDVLVAPGANLVPYDLTVPSQIHPGMSFSFGYSVRNDGPGLPAGYARYTGNYIKSFGNGIIGIIQDFDIIPGITPPELVQHNWTDKIYLSTKRTGVDATAICIGNFERTGTYLPVYHYYQMLTASSTNASGQKDSRKKTGMIFNDGYFLYGYEQIVITDTEVRIGVGNKKTLVGYQYVGDFYSKTYNLRTDNLQEGIYYMYVVVDADDNIYEFNGEEDNVIISGPITCSIPNISIELIDVSGNTLSTGNEVLIRWKMINKGSIDIQNYPANSFFFASTKADGSNPIAIGSTTNTVSLPAGGEKILRANVTIPNNKLLDGTLYFFVKTNIGDILETNTANYTSSGITQQFYYVEDASERVNGTNLTVSSVQTSLESTLGSQVSLSYVIKNTGSYEIDETVQQEVYISKSSTYDASARKLAASGSFADVTNLAPGESVNATVIVTIPEDIAGGKNYLHVVINEDNAIPEKRKDDNQAHAPIHIQGNIPNLAVSDIVVPETIMTSEETNVQWTLSNTGEWGAASVTCAVYLSADATYSNEDKLLTTVNSEWIAKNISQTMEATIKLEDDVVGTHYILVKADRDNALEETDKNDNTASKAFVAQQSPLPDLAISDLSYEGILRGGQTITLKAKVKNTGDHATRKDKWTDGFYLSEGYTFDITKAIKLGGKAHVGTLDKDSTYNVSVEVNLPNNLKGYYVLFAVTDETNTIIEKDENNNQEKTTVYLEDKNDTPADMVVKKLSSPSKIIAGENISVSYTLANEGAFVAKGTLHDVLYMSKDNKWDENDVMVGTVTGDIDLEPGNSVVRNVTGRISNMLEGNYYLIVRTNSNHAIAETDYNNNMIVQTSTSAVEFTKLTLGESAVVNTSGLFKLPLYSGHNGKTIGLYLTTPENSSAGIYTAFGKVPSTARYEHSSCDLERTEQEILIPDVKEGTYYILAQDHAAVSRSLNEFVIDGEQDMEESTMTLSAHEVQFGAASLSISEGGTNGWLSTEIHGALLDSIMDFRLARDGEIIPAEAVTFHDQTSSKATFNLNDAATGSYDVVTELPDGTKATLPNGFKVIPGTNVALGVRLDAPSTSRVDGYAPVNIAWVNGGNTDIVIRELLLTITGGYLSKTIEGFGEQLKELHIRPDVGQDNRGFVTIPPGMKETVNYYFKQTSNQTSLKLFIIK